MRKHHAAPPAPIPVGEIKPKTEIDYSPKDYSILESLRSGWKYVAVAGIILLMFWLIERYLY